MARPTNHPGLRHDAWPEADRAAYRAACQPGSPFDDAGPLSRTRAATRKSLCGTYGRWLAFLLREDVSLETETPGSRLTPERLQRYRAWLVENCASITVATYLGQLLMWHAALWPARDWDWLRAIQARHQRQAVPVRIKAARIVEQSELVDLGFSLMEQAAAMPLSATLPAGPRHPALLYRDGLMIALLAMRPLRQGNFLSLTIGRHLRQAPQGWEIIIPGEECKTGLTLRFGIPQQLVEPLERYLTTYRPALLSLRGPHAPHHSVAPAGHALWVTRCGSAMTAPAQQKQLDRHCRARFGHTVNAHLFRDCAATALADEVSGGVSLAADLLGHRSTVTTQAHYIAANQRKALRRVQEMLLARRRPLRRPHSIRSNLRGSTAP